MLCAVTNDPSSACRRVFIGNLNTSRVTRKDLEAIFCKYGTISGISIHKGFAFIQFDNEYSSRVAATAYDQQIIAGQLVGPVPSALPFQSTRTPPLPLLPLKFFLQFDSSLFLHTSSLNSVY